MAYGYGFAACSRNILNSQTEKVLAKCVRTILLHSAFFSIKRTAPQIFHKYCRWFGWGLRVLLNLACVPLKVEGVAGAHRLSVDFQQISIWHIAGHCWSKAGSQASPRSSEWSDGKLAEVGRPCFMSSQVLPVTRDDKKIHVNTQSLEEAVILYDFVWSSYIAKTCLNHKSLTKTMRVETKQTHSFQQFPVIFLWPTMEVAGSNLSGQAKASFSQIAKYNQNNSCTLWRF